MIVDKNNRIKMFKAEEGKKHRFEIYINHNGENLRGLIYPEVDRNDKVYYTGFIADLEEEKDD